MMDLNKRVVQFGMIGCGRISRKHLEAIQLYGKLTAVCDNNFQQALELAAETGATPYSSVEDLLSSHPEIEVVAICTPNGFHAEHSIKCLQAYKHVICEKPLCIDSRAGRQMLETARLTGKKLWVVKATRFFPAVKALQKAIQEGKMGAILQFQLTCCWNRPNSYFENSWRGKILSDGGILYTQFSHYIDALCWLVGTPQHIQGMRKNWLHQNSIELEDAGSASVLMENGAIGGISWTVNATAQNRGISLQIIGENGTVELGGNYMQELVYEKWSSGEDLLRNTSASTAVPPHQLMYLEIMDFLHGAQPISLLEGFEALASVEFIEKIYQNCPLIKHPLNAT